ncbi:MAG: flavodoxin family protein [Christensenellales bacterium]
MKVVLINGSPRKNGCTARALREVETQLQKNGIETEWFHVGNKPIGIAAGPVKTRCAAATMKPTRHDAMQTPRSSPVHYAIPRNYVLYGSGLFGFRQFQFKPAAAVVRRESSATSTS